jgi:hypothetical protein
MKREASLLLAKACDPLILSIELFNRPHDRGRISSTYWEIEVTTRFPISRQTTRSSGCGSARLYSMQGDLSRTSSVSK